MATNRHAQIRYNILDRCFSNFNRLYSYNDLLEEVNVTLLDLGTEGIKLRQLQYDIEHMMSDAGWAIELEDDLRKERKKAFRYADRGFSIANHPLNVNDTEQLETTLAILSRYKHREEFNWLEELIPRMQQAFNLAEQGENGVISYQENVDLKGREHIGVLFNLILKRKKAEIIYKPYGKPQRKIEILPYHLKQFNNRWFLFCKNEEYNTISNYPLDRIVSIIELGHSFIPEAIDWMDYFDDIVGVTHPEESEIEVVKLRFSKSRISYVKTKPLHPTQKPFREDLEERTITIEVKPNRELTQLILSFGPDVEVLEPASLRNDIKVKINQLKEIY